MADRLYPLLFLFPIVNTILKAFVTDQSICYSELRDPTFQFIFPNVCTVVTETPPGSGTGTGTSSPTPAPTPGTGSTPGTGPGTLLYYTSDNIIITDPDLKSKLPTGVPIITGDVICKSICEQIDKDHTSGCVLVAGKTACNYPLFTKYIKTVKGVAKLNCMCTDTGSSMEGESKSWELFAVEWSKSVSCSNYLFWKPDAFLSSSGKPTPYNSQGTGDELCLHMEKDGSGGGQVDLKLNPDDTYKSYRITCRNPITNTGCISIDPN
jgi:hypothetical protein